MSKNYTSLPFHIKRGGIFKHKIINLCKNFSVSVLFSQSQVIEKSIIEMQWMNRTLQIIIVLRMDSILFTDLSRVWKYDFETNCFYKFLMKN